MATVADGRPLAKSSFKIHEDAETSDIDEGTEARPVRRPQADYGEAQDAAEDDDTEELAGDDEEGESSDDNEPVDNMVQHDMEKLQETFPSFKSHYRLIKRIGEGGFLKSRPLRRTSKLIRFENTRHFLDSLQGRRYSIQLLQQ